MSALHWHCIDDGLAMDWHLMVGPTLRCPNCPPSRHFGRFPYSTLVRRSHVQTSSDRQRIGVICANVCQSCVDPVLMIGSDRCEERLFG